MTLTELKKGIDDYFNECESAGVFPDEAGMILYLGIPRDTLEKWLSNGRSGYYRAIRDARLRRESYLVRGIYSSEKSTTGKIFLSRQGSSGALGEKSGDKPKEVVVEVKINGIEDCFD